MLSTYAQLDHLADIGLAKKKTVDGLTIFKYARKAFYDSSYWGKYPELLECRGHVYDEKTKQIVQVAPRKSFNLHELGIWANVSDNAPVYAYKKFNGFLACLTVYNGKPVISTTGSLDSAFVKIAEKHLSLLVSPEALCHTPNCDFTYYYEICDTSDPHIVYENPGAYLLGYRDKETGKNTPWFGNREPDIVTFADAKEAVKNCMHEGFMVYLQSDSTCTSPVKLKSPYYIGKKVLMRMTQKQWEAHQKDDRHLRNRLDSRFGAVLDLHTLWKDWPDIQEQDRGYLIDNHFSIHGWVQ